MRSLLFSSGSFRLCCADLGFLTLRLHLIADQRLRGLCDGDAACFWDRLQRREERLANGFGTAR